MDQFLLWLNEQQRHWRKVAESNESTKSDRRRATYFLSAYENAEVKYIEARNAKCCDRP